MWPAFLLQFMSPVDGKVTAGKTDEAQRELCEDSRQKYTVCDFLFCTFAFGAGKAVRT